MTSLALQSKDHRQLLDSIDKLRSQGSSRYVDLPEIIVCGDQSAGKSSVLEAISGRSFPTKDNLCTRFPTELVLRRDEIVTTRITITPGPDRSAEESESLRAFHAFMDPNDGEALADVIEKAKASMNLSNDKEFCTDTLRVELSGPDQPHLTMVDLPGLFRAGNRDQSVEDARTIREMVKSYMERPRSIILAVVSAKSDAALQEVTELARELDPTGDRTLGLITKPDCLDAGSDMERSFLNLAKNQYVVFRLGWHVLKNRSYELRNISLAQRNEAEEAFFSRGIWASLDRHFVGVASLKTRLSKVLVNQILLQLPSLVQDVETSILDCQQKLQQLGTPRLTVAEQRQYLFQISVQFTKLSGAAVDGVYHDAFFGSPRTKENFDKRLRAVVQNTLADFGETMRQRGHTRKIVESPDDDEKIKAGEVSRSDYLDEVTSLMKSNRGSELQGTFNPLTIGTLFLEQCQPWRGIATSLIEDILGSMSRTAQAIIDHIAVTEVADEVWRIINEVIDKLKAQCNNKLEEVLKPHYEGHPITYNHYLTDQVQKAQWDRQRQAYETRFKKAYGSGCFDTSTPSVIAAEDHVTLLNALIENNRVGMERHAASLATDYMQAYYKVALEKFIDDIAVLAIEQCLVKKLPLLFSPDVVFALDDDETRQLAAESNDTSAERSRYTEKLHILESGLLGLKRLEKRRAIFTTDVPNGNHGETSDQGVGGDNLKGDQIDGLASDLQSEHDEADGSFFARDQGTPPIFHSTDSEVPVQTIPDEIYPVEDFAVPQTPEGSDKHQQGQKGSLPFFKVV